MTRKGCDYAWEHPDPAGLAANGFTFACRYLSHDPSKDVTLAEIQRLSAVGIDVVLNWESTETRPRSGHAGGVEDAQTVLARLPGLETPDDRPVYFSIDYPQAFAEIDIVDQYLRGVVETLGFGRVGAYGTYNVTRHLAERGTVAWFWQTASESQGHWQPGIHLQQVEFGRRIAGGVVDIDQAVALDFGQWRLTGAVQRTWMDDVMDNLPTLQQGSTGDPVRRAQALLVAAGYTINIDGDFGPKTDGATREFQGRHGLQVDGVWGKHTWSTAITGHDL